jgi:hypothetical protein
MATGKLQVIQYHRDHYSNVLSHFHDSCPQVGPVQFVDADGIGETGWTDGIISNVVTMDNIAYLHDDGVMYGAVGITVHNIHKDEVFGVTVFVPLSVLEAD